MNDKQYVEIDSEGNGPDFIIGDEVRLLSNDELTATVIRQTLHYDGPETFWGNVLLKFKDGSTGIAHCWQCAKVDQVLNK